MRKKEGISLIVLVITIIVIIILAAAVILTLTDNNPINNAKIANVVQNKDSLESSISLYLAQKIAADQGSYDNSQIILGNVAGTSAYSIAAVDDTDPTLYSSISFLDIGTIYEIDPVKFNAQTGVTLPSTNSTSAKWCIQPETGKVYLLFDSVNNYPSWIPVDVSNNITDSTLAGFVKVGALAYAALV